LSQEGKAVRVVYAQDRESGIKLFANQPGSFARARVVMGTAFGFAIGRSRAASDLLLPPLELLRPIPAVAWIPLSILMFPSSELSMIYIGCSNVHRATAGCRHGIR